jgi:hypothetical protein
MLCHDTDRHSVEIGVIVNINILQRRHITNICNGTKVRADAL